MLHLSIESANHWTISGDSILNFLKLIHCPRNSTKRVGAVAALVFPALNGYDFDAPEDDFADMVLAVAHGELGMAEVAVFIRRWSKQL